MKHFAGQGVFIFLQTQANWNFLSAKFSNVKLKFPRLVRMKFFVKFFLQIESLDFFKVFLKFQQLWLFFESIQNKLSRLDLTFFQLFYDGLFKQSFPSRNPKIPKFWNFGSQNFRYSCWMTHILWII